MTSVGFGDALPMNPVSRAIAMAQALTGQLYVAVLIARFANRERAAHAQRLDGDARRDTIGPRRRVHRDGDGTLVVRVSGDWSLEAAAPAPAAVEQEVRDAPPERLVFQARDLGRWDSSLVSYLASIAEVARGEGLAVDTTGLPKGLQHLLALAGRPPPATPPPPPHQPLPTRIGVAGIDFGAHAAGMLDFVGRASLAVRDVLIGRGHFERRDFWLLVEQTGGAALPLVAVINFLVGAVLAFLGAVQLEQFNATIYVANLVGVGTVRETGRPHDRDRHGGADRGLLRGGARDHDGELGGGRPRDHELPAHGVPGRAPHPGDAPDDAAARPLRRPLRHPGRVRGGGRACSISRRRST